MSRTAYSYIRFSTPEQAAGDSLRRQTELRDELVKRKGWHLDDSLTLLDAGVEAFRGSNLEDGSALSRFLDLVNADIVKKGSILIVESLDRISRQNMRKANGIINELLEKGISIATLAPSERIYEADDEDDLGAAVEILVTASRGNQESKIKQRRNREAWVDKRRTALTKRLTKSCPAWLTLKPDYSGFEVIEEKARVVRRIFELASDGLGAKRIARTLRTEQLNSISPASEARAWSNTTIHRLITNRTVLGEYQPCLRIGKHKRAKHGEPIAN